MLCKRIGWIPGINQTGAANCEKSFYLAHGIGDHIARLASLKLLLQLDQSVVRAIESVGHHSRNIKCSHWIFCEKCSCVGYLKLRGFQGEHVRSVRLIQQNGEFTKDGAGLRTFAISVFPFTIATVPFLRISRRPVVEPSAITVSPGW